MIYLLPFTIISWITPANRSCAALKYFTGHGYCNPRPLILFVASVILFFFHKSILKSCSYTPGFWRARSCQGGWVKVSVKIWERLPLWRMSCRMWASPSPESFAGGASSVLLIQLVRVRQNLPACVHVCGCESEDPPCTLSESEWALRPQAMFSAQQGWWEDTSQADIDACRVFCCMSAALRPANLQSWVVSVLSVPSFEES